VNINQIQKHFQGTGMAWHWPRQFNEQEDWLLAEWPGLDFRMMYTFFLAPVYLLSYTVDSEGTLPRWSHYLQLYLRHGVYIGRRCSFIVFMIINHLWWTMKGTYQYDKRGSNGGDWKFRSF